MKSYFVSSAFTLIFPWWTFRKRGLPWFANGLWDLNVKASLKKDHEKMTNCQALPSLRCSLSIRSFFPGTVSRSLSLIIQKKKIETSDSALVDMPSMDDNLISGTWSDMHEARIWNWEPVTDRQRNEVNREEVTDTLSYWESDNACSKQWTKKAVK